MKIVQKKFSLHINANDHLPPHCHVRFPDKSEVRVQIPLIIPMDGTTITKEVAEAIIEHLDELADAWDEYHSPKNFKKDKNKENGTLA